MRSAVILRRICIKLAKDLGYSSPLSAWRVDHSIQLDELGPPTTNISVVSHYMERLKASVHGPLTWIPRKNGEAGYSKHPTSRQNPFNRETISNFLPISRLPEVKNGLSANRRIAESCTRDDQLLNTSSGSWWHSTRSTSLLNRVSTHLRWKTRIPISRNMSTTTTV